MGNVDNAVKRIDALLSDDGQGWSGKLFWGKINKQTQAMIIKLKKDLLTLRGQISAFNSIKNDLYQPRTLEELKALGAQKSQEVTAKMQEFKAQLENIHPEITTTIQQFSDTDFKLNAYENASSISQMTGTVGNWLGSNFLATDQFKKIKNALGTLEESLNATLHFLGVELPNYEKYIQARLQSVPQFKAAPTPAPVIPGAGPQQAGQANQQKEDDWSVDLSDN